MSETSASQPLTTAELVRFAQHHGELVNRTRLLASKNGVLAVASRESGLPYAWVKRFATGEVVHADISRVCTLYLSLIGEKSN